MRRTLLVLHYKITRGTNEIVVSARSSPLQLLVSLGLPTKAEESGNRPRQGRDDRDSASTRTVRDLNNTESVGLIANRSN